MPAPKAGGENGPKERGHQGGQRENWGHWQPEIHTSEGCCALYVICYEQLYLLKKTSYELFCNQDF